ncbi:Stk1 family PASTA domain-containing Ser/Thr kinase [Microbacterium sp. cx-55]|uniref:Stk1 family PASTA domain-containing Ser/Thr kinase n=1 Tax=unclassified Microbacterium TaxID=2609290 RepID=UPI001CBAE93B|nr:MULTISPECIES: Stk1 family PASTA domain-containing Ser/Thr kinase [unclassified Microbacterium]MBZ4486656.1 Stk1 family PASTA domain-containing Ser/Thr kinase [Microbacterium sp. cx-55]MCC4907623.1 Stk1 family PASTA domain-containing Ser/Thr kinase [Microbacterium sp. cx-59]UGB36382.1 Stk1 family PASTA domain-containing Ser/Thr kinase [Microbacterium sp. cx-55]
MNTGQRADPLIGRLVDGRYRVRARIARGGMATVYVATDMRLERRVALKVMHGHLSDDTVFQSRFIQEARAAARLADPHVVNVFDQGQDHDMAYMVMEYLPGITLRDLMKEHRRLSIPQTITIMDAILSGLAAAHRAGIVHRDVKPENVLLAEDGRIKIGDFGLARATTANTASGQMLLGTIAYLAPELVTRGSADARSDIYALGIMLYEMLTGEQPYKGEQPMQIAYQHATDSVPRPSAKNPGVPEQLDELVLWATERSPDARPVDADEMLRRLRDIERELGVAPQVARTLAVGTAVAEEGYDSGELTRAMPASLTGPTAVADDTDNATLLRRRARRRTAKGGWLFTLVILLAAIAGGTGWWFGSGPGSLVAVPAVEGLSYEDASAALLSETLIAERGEEYSLSVQTGLVIRTEPGSGDRLDKDSTVRVIVSIGPQPHDLGPLTGTTLDAATATLQQAKVTVSDPAYVFTGAADGTVVSASVARPSGEAVDCTNGCTVYEGDTASLLVSRGSVPDVSGLKVQDAVRTLEGVDLVVSADRQSQFSNDVDKGNVIGIAGRDGGGDWRPGDTVTLIVSEGPELFRVPDVEGLTRDEAKSTLSAAGFSADYLSTWDLFPNGSTEVEAQDPGAGAMVERGTRISLRFNVSG